MKADIESFSELEKRRILSVLGDSRDLMEIASAKIFTTSKEGASWLYSDLEGFLCYLIDYQDKTQLLVLYDFATYEKLFQIELYLDFPKFYSELSNDFHCFETDNGFVGLKFLNKSEADAFSSRIQKFDSMNQLFKKSMINRRKNKYKKGKENVLLVKEQFLEDQPILNNINSYQIDEDIFEDGIEINKPSYYNFLNNITYDPYKRVFRLQDVSPDLKKLFKLCGLKKSDFKNESLALYTFKHLALCYDALQSKKKEKRKFLRNYSNSEQITSILEEDMNEIDIIFRKSLSAFEEERNKEATYVKLMNSGLIPAVPKLPVLPKIPTVNEINLDLKANEDNNSNIDIRRASLSNNFNTDLSKIKLKPVNNTVNQIDSNTEIKKDDTSSISSGTNNSFLDEIRKGVQLKKINVDKEEEKRPLKINKNDRGFLQTALQKAIQQRREELTKNDNSDESDSESEWSD